MSATAVTDSLTVPLDASPATVRDALLRVDLTGPMTSALEALDAGGRIALPPAVVGRAAGDGLRLGMVWRIDGSRPERTIEPDGFEAFSEPGHVKVRWEIAVSPAGGEGAYVSIRTGLLGTDRDAHARLLAAWGAVGPLSRGFVQRAARSIRSHAEDDERWQAAAEDDLRQVAA